MVIFLIAYDGARPVQLFCEQQAYQLMGECQLGEGPAVVCPFEDGLIQPINTSDEEDQLFCAFICPGLDKLGEPFRAELFAVFVQCDKEVVFGEGVENAPGLFFLQVRLRKGGCIFGDGNDGPFYRVIARDPPGEVIDAWFYVGFVIFADGPELNFHVAKLIHVAKTSMRGEGLAGGP